MQGVKRRPFSFGTQRTIANVVAFKGNPVFDTSKPDVTPLKLLSFPKLALPRCESYTSLTDRLKLAYAACLDGQRHAA